ncbi:unnamed protein product [Cyclocybe aegerita]|uniref:Uncharacterized protein n=1 Tax=Cyclocybe aegerita TaxID=1973307 RepID=A0A8S0VSW2_CYCAE|nr:unnamed protein product [Cyclocybe aegerita]
MPSLVQVESFVLTTNTHGVELRAPMKEYTRTFGSEKGTGATGVILLLGHGAGFFDGFLKSKVTDIWNYGDGFATLVNSGLLGPFDRGRNLGWRGWGPPNSSTRLPDFSRIIIVDPAMTSNAFDDKESDIYRFVKSTTPTRKDTWCNPDTAAAWLKARLPWATWDERVFDCPVDDDAGHRRGKGKKHGLRALPTVYYPDKMSEVTLTTHRLAENIAFEGKQYASNALDQLSQICIHLPAHLIFGGKNDLL